MIHLHYQWHPQHKYQPNLSNVWYQCMISIYWEKKQTKYIDSFLNIWENRHQMILRGQKKKGKKKNLASSSSPTAPVKSTTKEPKSSTAFSPLVPSPAWDCTFVKKEKFTHKIKINEYEESWRLVNNTKLIAHQFVGIDFCSHGLCLKFGSRFYQISIGRLETEILSFLSLRYAIYIRSRDAT